MFVCSCKSASTGVGVHNGENRQVERVTNDPFRRANDPFRRAKTTEMSLFTFRKLALPSGPENVIIVPFEF